MGFCGSSPKSQLFLFQVSFEESKHLSYWKSPVYFDIGTLTKGSYVLAQRRGNSDIKTMIITYVHVINVHLVSLSLAVVEWKNDSRLGNAGRITQTLLVHNELIL